MTDDRSVARRSPHDDLIDRLAFALEARDVQRGGSPHITPGNRFYRESAAALIALMPPPVLDAAAPDELRAVLLHIFDMAENRPDIRAVARAALRPAGAPEPDR